MKGAFFLLCIGVALVLVQGCQKDVAVEPVQDTLTGNGATPFTGWDTIFPGCYVPAWPGSYWTYQRHDGTTYTITAGNWHLWANYDPYSAPTDTSHCCWLPTYNGDVMRGYLVRYGNGMPGPNNSPWRRLLPDSIYPGAQYLSYIDAPETTYRGDILTVDSTVTVNGVVYNDVVVASIHYELLPANGSYRTLNFYVCDVGLIRVLRFENDTLAWQHDLIDHYITP